MRFVAVKTEEQQARAMIFRTRDLLVRQRTQLINALRGHLAEHGVVAPQGPAHVKRLADAIEDGERFLPPIVRDIGRVYLDQIALYSEKIADLDKKTPGGRDQGRDDARGCRLCRALGRSPPWPSKPSRRRCTASDGAATSRPGWVLCLGRSQPGASRSWGRPRRWASATSAGC